MPHHSKGNISSPVHLTFKTQLGSPAAPSSAKIPAFQSPGKIVLTRTLDKEEGVREGPEKEIFSPKPAPDIQSGFVSAEKLSLQSPAVRSSSHQAAFMWVNTKPLPVHVTPSALPSGHHLQIPADAQVRSVPASFLPPAVQQKILAAAASSVSGGADSTKMPTVIYVSPVNTVRTALPRQLPAPKPDTEVSKPVILSSSSPETPDGQQCHQTPMKWIVQESPQSAASCLIPVKSSNNVASKILKTLSDTKDAEVNTANIISLCSSGGQTKFAPLKDNALIMYKGKVYLLTKRSSDAPSAQADKQASSSSDASLNEETSSLADPAEVTKITSEAVNLVVSNSKGMELPQEDSKPFTNSKNTSPGVLRNDLKSAAVVTPSAHQQNSPVPQRKSLSFSRSISSGVTPVAAAGTQEQSCPDGTEKNLSPPAASAALPQSQQDCAFSEDWKKIQSEKMHSPGIPNKQQEKPHWKQYLELRKKFGLSKVERVYLKRIPLRTSCEKPEEKACWNYSWSSSSLDVEVTNPHQECVKEEKRAGDLQEDLTRKRKTKSSPLSDTGKRRRTSGRSTTSPSSGSSSSNSGVSPPPLLPQQSLPTASVPVPLGQDPEEEQNSTTGPSIPVMVSCEGGSPVFEGSFRDDAFPLTPPDLDETIRDEKIKRLKQLLREREAALEEVRKKLQQS
ncbi:ligand-dependent nuclear receptor-interacting factor 1 isoform X2 [Heliangelus exortis]